MTWTDPVDPTAGVTAFTAAREKTYILDNLRAIAEWTSYSPTVTQSGTPTKTNTFCYYRQFGGTGEVNVYLTMTGAGTANNVITVSLPFTAMTASEILVGSGEILDSGTLRIPCRVVLASTTSVKFWRSDSTTPTDYIGKDPNFALANTDLIRFYAKVPLA